MKNLFIALSAVLIILIMALLFASTLKGVDYANFTHVNDAVQSDSKYVLYFYLEDDVNSARLVDDITKFANELESVGVPFYAIDMDERKNGYFFAESTDQSGVDYPVTPEQVNELGLENYVIAGTPDMVYVEGGQAKYVGVGVQTSEMGNSYISVQDTMASILNEFGIEFKAEYEYEG